MNTMLAKRLLATAALIGFAAGPVLAQTASPAAPSRPAVTSPATPSSATPSLPSVADHAAATTHTPAATVTTASPVAKKVDLNTATAAEIDALPDIGKARSKAILEERAKGKFKDWADFDKRMTGTHVNAGAKAQIKDHVTF
jgi:competence protein ComEA